VNENNKGHSLLVKIGRKLIIEGKAIKTKIGTKYAIPSFLNALEEKTTIAVNGRSAISPIRNRYPPMDNMSRI
jgi:hypothetical protein